MKINPPQFIVFDKLATFHAGRSFIIEEFINTLRKHSK